MSRSYLETIKAVDGIVHNLSYHQQRLERTLLSKRYDLREKLNPPQNGLYRCRVVYSEDNFEVEYIPYKKRVVNSLKLVYSDDIEYAKKYEIRDTIDELYALKANCDDIVIVKSGLITDTSIANIAFYDGEKWLTPKRALLEGTTRERYLQSGFLTQVDIFVDELQNFKKMALMNAMIDFDIIAQENIEDIVC